MAEPTAPCPSLTYSTFGSPLAVPEPDSLPHVSPPPHAQALAVPVSSPTPSSNPVSTRVQLYQQEGGVVAYDSSLNRDPDTLLQFLYEQSAKPELWVQVQGYHIESRPLADNGPNAADHAENGVHYRPEVVVDFCTQVEVTSAISAEPQVLVRQIDSIGTPTTAASLSSRVSLDSTTGLLTTDDSRGLRTFVRHIRSNWHGIRHEGRSLRDVLHEYTESRRQLKELRVQKEVEWDYEALRSDVEQLFREEGYQHRVRVRLLYRHHRVIIRSSYLLMRWLHQSLLRVYCFLTCVWLCVVPIYYVFLRRWKDDVKLSYAVEMPTHQFVRLHRHHFLRPFRRRHHGTPPLVDQELA
ncbi:hypothetical protein H4R34_001625 [Dimargaris verticillata]|uniref:Transmembrane protein n=1 Tax=Dimargaris verticillata TaxID=2761393 RepID=A0A9W8B396_9FUNG|nr:hypothetical protein H4R34_001625 [Dimargaris verticillata]